MSRRIGHIASNDFRIRSTCSGVIDQIAAIYTAKSQSKPARQTATHATRPSRRECPTLMGDPNRQQIHLLATKVGQISSNSKDRVSRYASPAETAPHPH